MWLHKKPVVALCNHMWRATAWVGMSSPTLASKLTTSVSGTSQSQPVPNTFKYLRAYQSWSGLF